MSDPSLSPEMQQALDIAHAATRQISPVPPTAAPPDATKLKGVPMGPMTKDKPVSPQQGGNTNPAYNQMGLKESDVAPGGPASKAAPQAPEQPAVQPTQIPEPQTVQAGPPTYNPLPPPEAAPLQVIAKDVKTDPVKAAAAEPGFWDKVKSVGGDIFEVLGDIAAGYSHQQSTPTQQRLAREHSLRMQGNEIQGQKDLLSIQQGFQQKQLNMENEFRTKDQALAAQIASTQDVNAKAQLQEQKDALAQELQIAKMRNDTERFAAQQQYGFQFIMNRVNKGGVDALMGQSDGK